MKQIIILVVLLFFVRTHIHSSPYNAPLHRPLLFHSVYEDLKGASKPDFSLFEKAYLGYIDLKLSGLIKTENNILSIIDFRKPSTEKRLWVIDLSTKIILFHTYVAHGENSGKDYALYFSNEVNSHKSSLGFYLTEETYFGINGLSLKLNGLEYGINNNARKRYIVLHGADYATKDYIEENGTLGKSKGCPAIPMGIHQSVIDVTKNGSCLFIYFPDLSYTEKSMYFNE